MLKKLVLSLSLVGGLAIPAGATLVKQLNVVYNDGTETLSINRKKIAEITYTQDKTSSPKSYSIHIAYNDGTETLTIDRTKVEKITFSEADLIPVDLVDMNMIITTSTGEKNLMWAKYNVGATAEGETGKYYAWGEYTDKTTTDGYSWTTYKFTETEDGSAFTKYTEDGAVLASDDDVTTHNQGEEYRLPTHAEWEKLNDTTAYTWTQEGDNTWAKIATGTIANGYRVKCVANGNSIFLPAAGFYKDKTCKNRGVYGAYWSSTLQSGKMAYDVEFGTYGHWTANQSASRFSGHTVRAVSEQTKQ